MTSKERFIGAINYKGFDRMPSYYSGHPVIDKKLMDYFKVDNYIDLINSVGHDMRGVYPTYIGPELKKFDDGSYEGIFGERYKSISFGVGSYDESVYMPYADITDVEQLENIRFPSADWYDYSTIKSQCEKLKDYALFVGNPDKPDYINGIARCRGVEQVLMDIGLEEPVYIRIMEKWTDFHYQYFKNCLEAAKGLIDVVWLGEDLGTQNGPLISLEKYKKLFAAKHKKFYDLAHEYGAKSMMHSCGGVRSFIPELINNGLDILDVVQVNAAGMNIKDLHKDFYGKIVFAGSISTQSTIAFGSIEDIINEVELRKKLFSKGGMIIGPSNPFQDDTPIEKVIAMYKAIGSIK